jgi:hypothetical protein
LRSNARAARLAQDLSTVPDHPLDFEATVETILLDLRDLFAVGEIGFDPIS